MKTKCHQQKLKRIGNMGFIHLSFGEEDIGRKETGVAKKDIEDLFWGEKRKNLLHEPYVQHDRITMVKQVR